MKDFPNKMSTGNILLFLAFTLFFASVRCSFENRVRIEKNQISVIYEHQLDGKKHGFEQTINTTLFNAIQPEQCSTNANIFCLKWGNVGMFNITKTGDGCEYFQFTTTFQQPINVIFDISDLHLYGGGEQNFQPWPAQTLNYEKYSFVSKELDSQAVLEPYWLTSTGLYLYVDAETPLFITQNSRRKVLELIADRRDPYTLKPVTSTNLKYTVCKKCCMKTAHNHAVQTVLGKPSGIPDERMIRDPIWSTWAKYKSDINEQKVLEFASKIVENKLTNSQIEIDDRWQTCYGSLIVDKTRFPDMKKLVENLKTKGFRVTVWVHPFVNVDCYPFYNDGVREGYFVKDDKGSVATKWWNGAGAYIDFTNPKAVDWYTSRLKAVKAETGIDSFKFDAGESSWTPQPPVFQQMKSDYPETILKSYVDVVSQFGSMIEVRSGRGTQSYPIFVRMIDRDTNWDKKLGLQTLIPCLLQMNIVGYPLVLPDMIGGNGYGATEIVTDEMFIRWLQINTFMPALQFSYPPWEYSEKVLEVTKKYVALHAKYADKIIAAMKKAVTVGTPVNPPIWWADPHDPVTYNIDDEFLLGEDLLVAPIVKKGSLSRNIYLPKGVWRNEMYPDKAPIKGPTWLYNYEVPLEQLPYFTKVGEGDDDHHHDDGEKSGAYMVVPSLLATGLSILTILRLFFFTL